MDIYGMLSVVHMGWNFLLREACTNAQVDSALQPVYWFRRRSPVLREDSISSLIFYVEDVVMS